LAALAFDGTAAVTAVGTLIIGDTIMGTRGTETLGLLTELVTLLVMDAGEWFPTPGCSCC